MGKREIKDMYRFINYRTKKFQKKTFASQNDFFVLVDVVHIDNPQIVLSIEPIFRKVNDKLIKVIRDHEMYGHLLPQSLFSPFYGVFPNVASSAPLIKFYTEDDVRTGHCIKEDIGKYIVDENGNYIVFNSIPVFCKQTLDNENYQLYYNKEWNPIDRARRKYEWCYTPLNTHQVTSFSI